jgi:ferrous iron transport protein B
MAADNIGTRYFQSATESLWSARIDRILLHPWLGLLGLAAVVFGVYEIVGVLLANQFATWAEHLLQATWVPWVRATASLVFSPRSLPFRLLAGEHGLLTMTATYLAALLLPLIMGFYLLLAAMEDSGSDFPGWPSCWMAGF